MQAARTVADKVDDHLSDPNDPEYQARKEGGRRGKVLMVVFGHLKRLIFGGPKKEAAEEEAAKPEAQPDAQAEGDKGEQPAEEAKPAPAVAAAGSS